MAALTEAERKVVDWIAGERAATLGLIEALVNTDSGSLDKAGVDAAGACIRGFLDARGIACDIVPNERYGDGIRATVGDDRRAHHSTDGPPRHRLCARGGGTAAVPRHRRPRLGSRLLRHEGRARDERHRAVGIQDFRSRPARWSRCSPPTRRSARRPRAR